MRHRRLVSAAVLALLVVAGCQRPADAPPAASDDTLKQRVVSWFQRAVPTPGLTLEVTKLEPAEMPGWKKGVLQAKLNDQSQDAAFYVSNDGHWVFRGDVADLTIDPEVALMKRINLEGQPSRGPANAPVTIVEYSDFQCPYCGRAWEIVEKEVLPAYGDKVRFVFKQLPLKQIHPWAEAAAMASECALKQGNDQFWTVYNVLFENQEGFEPGTFGDQLGEKLAGKNVDVPKLRVCLDAKETAAAVEADEKEAIEIGAQSTPYFVINGRRVQGAQDANAFKQVIDAQLAAGSEKK